MSGSRALPPRWLPQCNCVVIESSFDPGERLQAPGSLWFLIFCVFFRLSLAFINLLGRFFVSRALQFFLLLLNMCPLSRQTRFVCSMMLITMCMVCICIFMFNDVNHYVYGLYLYTTGKRTSHLELQ